MESSWEHIIFVNMRLKLPFGSTLNLYGYCFWLYVDICIGIGIGIVVGVGICIGIYVGVGIDIGVGIGSISQHLASGGIWAGSIWQHLGSSVTSGIIWQHLGAPGIIWRHLAASELAASGILRQHLAASGIIWAARQSDPSSGGWKSSPGPEIKPWRPEIEKENIHFCETVIGAKNIRKPYVFNGFWKMAKINGDYS